MKLIQLMEVAPKNAKVYLFCDKKGEFLFHGDVDCFKKKIARRLTGAKKIDSVNCTKDVIYIKLAVIQ